MATPGGKTYYEVLGVPPSASLNDIKKRYRELARQYHPDVNRDKPNVAKLFSEITTAYKTLSDADARAIYDAELALRERRTATATGRAAAAATAPGGFPPGGAPAPPRPAASRPAAHGGGARPASAAGNRSATAAADTARLVAEAQAAFVRGKFVEARALCEQALRVDRRNAAAYEILGDVYRLQGRTDDAIHMYTMAIQLNPRNQTVMQRLERLARSGGPSAQKTFFDNRGAASAAYRAQTAPPPRDFPPGGQPGATAPRRPMADLNGDKRSLGTLIVGMIGYGLAFLMILYLAVIDKGVPFGDGAIAGVISAWSTPLVVVMALAGAVVGFTLAATAAVRRIDDELIFPGARGRGGIHVPLGLWLIVVSTLSFYAAALLYAILGLLQESLAPSMARVFGAVVAIVLLVTAVYDPGRVQVLLFGGNVVFLALLIGWALGDFFRPDGF